MNYKNTSAFKALMVMYNEEKGDTLKKIEKQVDSIVESHQPYFIRLDGCSFSKFLKGVVKPFDYRITDAMVKTTADLVAKFQPTLGYTSSDEISLIFLERNAVKKIETEAIEGAVVGTSDENIESGSRLNKKPRVEVEHIYNGRIQKIASIAAGFASARFNYHLMHTVNKFSDLDDIARDRLLGGNGYFDARVVPCPDHSALVDTIFWRSNFDAFRNSICQISLSQYSPKSLHGLSINKQLIKLENEKGLNILKDYHPRYLFGTWVKKQKYRFIGKNPLTNQDVAAIRTRLVCGSFNWADWSEAERLEFTLAKFWPVPKCPEIENEQITELISSPETIEVKKQKKVFSNRFMVNPPPIDEENSKLLQK